MSLSKSLYTKGVQCPKMLWMRKHMPEQFDESVMNEKVLNTGNVVGDLAMGYYGDFTEVPFDAHDMTGMAQYTQELMKAGVPTICEATFIYEGCLCMVDILRVAPDGVHIIEVKSSSHMTDIYYHDMAFQTWVLRQCGLNVLSVSLMHLNSNYVRHGELDLHELFTVENCTEQVMAMQAEVATNVPLFNAAAKGTSEPVMPIGDQCRNPYPCGYHGWCWRDVPQPSVFDLNRIQFKKALGAYEQGIATYEDIRKSGMKLNVRQKAQVDAYLDNQNLMVDKAGVQAFLDTCTFPLYFLDFETYQPAIPPFDNVKPYAQIPSQYSLHVLRAPDAELEHYEFLAEAGPDPRRSVAEHLVQDIPQGVCTMAYNMSFEKGRIKEMAELYPDLAEHLLAINEGMVDLIVPFSRTAVYARAMGGSNSIKYVLPALFPDDPELDYHNLEGVHNGSQAMAAFEDMEHMTPEEVAVTRENLLRYCELDTYAMVRIYERLVELAQ